MASVLTFYRVDKLEEEHDWKKVWKEITTDKDGKAVCMQVASFELEPIALAKLLRDKLIWPKDLASLISDEAGLSTHVFVKPVSGKPILGLNITQYR